MTDPPIFTSNLPCDQDMIKALGGIAIPMSLFTDACFGGIGEDNTPLLIAVERKKIGDLAQCINDGRLIHQLLIARENSADVFALVVEGRYRRNPNDGVLEIPVWGINPRTLRRAELWQPVRPFTQFSRFEQFLVELDWLANVIVKHSEDVRGTADIIKALCTNFQKPPSEHQSLNVMFSPPPATAPLSTPNLLRRISKELPGIGWGRSKVVADHFLSVKAMCEAPVKEWQSLDGVGKVTAERVVAVLRGEK